MDEDTDDESPLEEAVSGAVIALTFLVGFGLLAAGVPYFWVAFPVGFAGLLPMALGLAKLYRRRAESGTERARTESEEALEELRQRYARGELTDEEFEQQVERLLETESVSDARTFAERERERTTKDEPEREWE
jgi:uncharacterized membrane protein